MKNPCLRLVALLLALGLGSQTAYAQGTTTRFQEIGRTAGFNRVGHGRGAAWADLDGDGLEDFGIGLMAGGTHADGGFWFYRNMGHLKFEERRDAAGLHITDTVYGVTFPDVDNDGDSDVFVNCGGYQPTDATAERNRLFLNDGHGNFTEVPDAGGLSLLGFNFTSAWDDINGDGLLDVFICRLGPDGNIPDRRLFLNRGNAHFEDATAAAGLVSIADSHQAVFFDMEGDGDADLAIANRDTRVTLDAPPQIPNELYRNNGDGTFTDVSESAGISVGRAGFVCDVADYDRDGDLDIFMGAYNNLVNTFYVPGAHDDLYRNDGGGHFTEVSEAAGVAIIGGSMGTRFWDYDSDGYPDLYVSKGGAEVNRSETDRMFHNNGDGTFTLVGVQIGLANRTAGHGPTACDADHDGDLDFLVPSGSMQHGTEARSLFYENLGPTGTAVSFRPQGEHGNKDAAGARVLLRIGDIHIIGQVTEGSGYSSMPPAVVWFGLGTATMLDEVKVIWRSGFTRTATNVPIGRELPVLLPAEFHLGTVDFGPLNGLNGRVPTRFQWQDPRPGGQGRFEITVSGSASGVTLPLVAETTTPDYSVELPPGAYTWSVRLLDGLGEVSRATPAQQPVDVQPEAVTSPRLAASPNPFRGSIAIVGFLPPNSPAMEVEILDATGRRVAVVRAASAQSTVVTWNGKTARGTTAPSGIYWARLMSSGGADPIKLVRL